MSATFSPCGFYRYRLSRKWGNGPRLAFIMLNPSTADVDTDDPTIRRCVRFARDAGYDGIVVGNLFAWRATDPTELRTVAAPIGPGNDAVLADIICGAPVVVCAWGGKGALFNRNQCVLQLVWGLGRVPHCLRTTRGGHPAHPLYLPAHLRPIPIASL
jgi:hypothetical protein